MLLAPCVYSSGDLRCGDVLVSSGDDRRDVEAACGPPTFMEAQQAEKTVKTYQRIHERRVDKPQPGAKTRKDGQVSKGERRHDYHDLDRDYGLVSAQTVLINIEEWTYNFGPNRFIETLVFENDELVSITSGGYGFDQHPSQNPIVEKGDSKALVVMKYGQPAYTDKRQGENVSVTYREDGDYLYAEELREPANEEDWTYDLGPDRFLQKLCFKNNRLVDIRSLEKRGTRKGI